MKQHYSHELSVFETDSQLISYRLYINRYHPKPRRLVLLHGAGVAGQDTWEHVVSYLSHWSEVLVPDLRGMGQTHFPDGLDRPFAVQEVVDDLSALLDELNWWQFDLGGYSFGGLVSLLFKARYPQRVEKQYVLESALLDRESIEEVIRLRERYREAATAMREEPDPQQGIRRFLDAISPNRIISPRAEEMTIARLAQRPLGFSFALDAVSVAARELDRETLLAGQGDVSSFGGGRSVDALHQYQQALCKRLPRWTYHVIKGTDHSLPYQKPRQIARQMNADLDLYLQSPSG